MKLRVRQNTLDNLDTLPSVQNFILKALTALLGAQRNDENGRLLEIDDIRLDGNFDETLTINDLMQFDRNTGLEKIVSTDVEMYVVMRTVDFNDPTILVPRGFSGGDQVDEEGNNENVNWSEWLSRSGGRRTFRTSTNGNRVMFSLTWKGQFLDIRDILVLHNRSTSGLFDELTWEQKAFSEIQIQFYTRGEWLTEVQKTIWQESE